MPISHAPPNPLSSPLPHPALHPHRVRGPWCCAVVTMLHMASIRAAKRMFEDRSARMLQVFDEMEDFYLEIHWDIHSWVCVCLPAATV